eukprot:TRINITY_DN7835_c0_g5_i1.p1 TRINITY_DN7835_c0_g5~~TRINITY_DN7835_c0_g5_i1.p1  ORF type:complete len:271 (-),score=83.49 TRINITY_DN7835_c0_g5_i1:89-901(-)
MQSIYLIKQRSKENSSHLAGSDSVIMSKAKDAKQKLDKIEIETLSEIELCSKGKEIIDKFFIDITQLNPDLGYIFNKVKANTDKEIKAIKNECSELKNANEKYKETVKELKRKISNAEIASQQLKSSSELLKGENEELRGKFLDLKKKLAQIIEAGISNKISEEMEELFNESQYSRQLICTLKNNITRMQLREEFLLDLMKKHKVFSEEVMEQLQGIQPLSVEVGKNRVKVPMLDFSMVGASVSSEEQDNAQENPAHVSENYCKTHNLSL